MDLYLLDSNFITRGIIDSYESLIWTKRFYEAGDFEIYLPMNKDVLNAVNNNTYVSRPDDNGLMVIEKINVTTDAEKGNHLIVSGRSIESVLSRRIIWTQTNFTSEFESCIKHLLDKNAINPSDSDRKIPQLIYGNTLGITTQIKKQVTYDKLYDVIVEMCKAQKVGWKIVLNNDKKLVFQLYKGVDRSYNQNAIPYVVFSPKFDNLVNTSYSKDETDYASVALVAGEGEGINRKTKIVTRGNNVSGFKRYETYVDARDLSSNTEETITTTEYYDMLGDRGIDALAERKIIENFEGEVEVGNTYKYRKDWNVGDIVQVENEYGIQASPRIIEVIESDDTDGTSIIPTFDSWEV